MYIYLFIFSSIYYFSHRNYIVIFRRLTSTYARTVTEQTVTRLFRTKCKFMYAMIIPFRHTTWPPN